MNLRKCVVSVIRNSDGAFLAGKRTDHPDVWQFPQGGINADETILEGAYREVMEEVAIASEHLRLVKQAEKTSKYLFPADMKGPKAAKYAGQELYWVLFEYVPKTGFTIDLAKSVDKEFSEVKWKSVEAILEKVTEWKQQAYRAGKEILELD